MKSTVKKQQQRGEETRNLLIEAAEQLMLEEGYAAVTARRLMAKASLKSQLLHYYFESIDDLFLAVIRRRFEVNFRSMLEALSSSDPMSKMWDFFGDEINSRLSIEFLALASHRPAMREEVQRYAVQNRQMQTEAFSRFFELNGIEPEAPAIVSAMVITALWQMLHLEAVHGIDLGHSQLRDFIGSRLQLFNEQRSSAKKTSRKKPVQTVPARARRSKASKVEPQPVSA